MPIESEPPGDHPVPMPERSPLAGWTADAHRMLVETLRGTYSREPVTDLQLAVGPDADAPWLQIMDNDGSDRWLVASRIMGAPAAVASLGMRIEEVTVNRRGLLRRGTAQLIAYSNAGDWDLETAAYVATRLIADAGIRLDQLIITQPDPESVVRLRDYLRSNGAR